MMFKEQMQADLEMIEEELKASFRGRPAHADIYDAMNYSLLSGGKRIRPVLTLETCRMCGGNVNDALPFACAVEMIHTYSLIHDDLPCMDDDDLRRGRPTNHKMYGEATAVLAGDGLLTAAFECGMENAERRGLDPAITLDAMLCLARAAGADGMVGGQVLDMAGEGRCLTQADVEELQRMKTGALIRAAAEMGCIVAGGSEDDRKAVRRYAQKLGLAFQIRDDMLDVTGDEATLGKPIGSDARDEKTTFVSLKGLEACGRMVEELTVEAREALEHFENPGFLMQLAEAMVARKN